jgi:hypothetical protein
MLMVRRCVSAAGADVVGLMDDTLTHTQFLIDTN